MHTEFMNKKGQTTVEFMILMGMTASLLLTFMVLFHKQIAGFFFYLVGGILG